MLKSPLTENLKVISQFQHPMLNWYNFFSIFRLLQILKNPVVLRVVRHSPTCYICLVSWSATTCSHTIPTWVVWSVEETSSHQPWLEAMLTETSIWIWQVCVVRWNMRLVPFNPPAGPWFNIKMSSYQYRKSHYGDKTILWSSHLHNGISYTVKTTSLYLIRALVLKPGCWRQTGLIPWLLLSWGPSQ